MTALANAVFPQPAGPTRIRGVCLANGAPTRSCAYASITSAWPTGNRASSASEKARGSGAGRQGHRLPRPRLPRGRGGSPAVPGELGGLGPDARGSGWTTSPADAGRAAGALGLPASISARATAGSSLQARLVVGGGVPPAAHRRRPGGSRPRRRPICSALATAAKARARLRAFWSNADSLSKFGLGLYLTAVRSSCASDAYNRAALRASQPPTYVVP